MRNGKPVERWSNQTDSGQNKLAPSPTRAMAAICGAIDLVFDLSNRACSHALMKRRYFELLAKVQDSKLSLNNAYAEMSRFSADEEPAFHALLALCWNSAQEMVYGDKADCYRMSPWTKFWSQIFRFDGKKFVPVKSTR